MSHLLLLHFQQHGTEGVGLLCLPQGLSRMFWHLPSACKHAWRNRPVALEIFPKMALTIPVCDAEANNEWQDGDLSWDGPAVANAPAPAWYWRNRVFAPASGPQPHVPATAPAYVQMPGANKQMPSWAHQASYFASAAQVCIGLPS